VELYQKNIKTKACLEILVEEGVHEESEINDRQLTLKSHNLNDSPHQNFKDVDEKENI
jgi:hypothetical protein